MKVREQFVLRALDKQTSFKALCREFKVSRKTGYKWVARYKKLGVRGLEALSRRPNESPLATSADVVAEVVALRNAHPTWGPKKLCAVLRREGLVDKVPGTATVARILERTGLVQPARRIWRRKPTRAAPQLVVSRPNDVWTVDYKGWWLVSSGRCEPLTVRDAFSRYVLEVKVLSTTATEPTRQAFERLFSRYGIPRTILSDNGSPFAANRGQLGLSRLSAWWLSLGIDVQHSRPGTPSDNGGHERMHRDIKAELQRFSALTMKKQQIACDRWRHDFNNHRPHEAFRMQVPAALYRRSAVEFDERRTQAVYPDTFTSRLVSKHGTISVGGKPVFISTALCRQHIGLEPLGLDRYAVWYYSRHLGVADVSSVPVFKPAPPNSAPPLALRAPARQNHQRREVA